MNPQTLQGATVLNVVSKLRMTFLNKEQKYERHIHVLANFNSVFSTVCLRSHITPDTVFRPVMLANCKQLIPSTYATKRTSELYVLLRNIFGVTVF